ncbi:MAG: CDP-alcohol phosphatidyltransferase family protein [Candidatus Pacebacteria bacterium]|nr:CDP-alcohol phosphatidyltransferase family protein [Candidatus Paceibacterota bacterium]
MTITDKIFATTFLRLVPRCVRPNHFTVFRFLTIPFIFWFLWFEMYVLGGVLFLLSVFTDALDGSLARTRDQCTQWGKMYDPLADKLLIVTVGAVLIVRFLDIYVFCAVLIIELLLILNAGILKFFKKKVTGAHLTGKIKMICQSLGLVALFIYAMYGSAMLLVFTYGLFYMAIFFGTISLVVYKSA